ncbi:hypothetical protein GOP47_0021050 [Adiantum capillus-veneris]|uniref:Threonine/serine exporter-like N-terminal domain-containing protein n=1 Tax=Adiantum capillus-veneris TaxID=13818 RepID=A0A9D4UAV2_ADICA|nr:hypothetical protein GOP47_0021050 [Adiantum capillus-veneris]
MSRTSSLAEQKLLGAISFLSRSTEGGRSNHDSPCFSRQNTTVDDDDAFSQLQALDSSTDNASFNVTLRRRFLYRLAVALHSYGSSASRTEYLIERAAERLDVKIEMAVFPSLILLSFLSEDDESRNDVHLVTVESDLDADKLGRADELANCVGKHDTQLLAAYWKLRVIAMSHSRFEYWHWRLLSFALSASTAALLFFSGSLWDAVISFILGLVVGVLDTLSKKSHILANLNEFTSALVVSLLARIVRVHLAWIEVCFSNIALSSLVQLLPGMALTLGVSDMVAKSHVMGTSRIIHAFFSALQLGFGLSMGDRLVWWAQDRSLEPETCEVSSLSFWWDILWFIGYTISSSILLNARLKQWPGMALASGVGYIVSSFTGQKLGSNGSSVLAALAVGVTGTSYSYFTGDLPLIMNLAGILLLVPGGLGVQGITAMLQDDVLSGMGFVFKMLVIGLSITIGLLLAKVVFPASLFGHGRRSAKDKSTLAAEFEEEDMAI